MESTNNGEIVFDFPPLIREYKDGRIERLVGNETTPPSENDPKTGVSSKDVVIDPETGISARIYLPKITTHSSKKLPLLIYFHGGGFCIETPFSPFYHHYLNSLVSEANVVAVSVDYRRAPEYPLPIAYEDSWVSLKWVFSHSNGDGNELWINTHVDFDRVFVAGDSAGANISHNMAIRAGNSENNMNGVKIFGIVLIHPYFWRNESIGVDGKIRRRRDDKLWLYVCPTTTGCDDPLINPSNDVNISKMGCKRVLICVAEMDVLRENGWFYYGTLKKKKSGWNGDVEIMETKGEGHVFHLFDRKCEKARDLMKRIVWFLNDQKKNRVICSSSM